MIAIPALIVPALIAAATVGIFLATIRIDGGRRGGATVDSRH